MRCVTGERITISFLTLLTGCAFGNVRYSRHLLVDNSTQSETSQENNEGNNLGRTVALVVVFLILLIVLILILLVFFLYVRRGKLLRAKAREQARLARQQKWNQKIRNGTVQNDISDEKMENSNIASVFCVEKGDGRENSKVQSGNKYQTTDIDRDDLPPDGDSERLIRKRPSDDLPDGSPSDDLPDGTLSARSYEETSGDNSFENPAFYPAEKWKNAPELEDKRRASAANLTELVDESERKARPKSGNRKRNRHKSTDSLNEGNIVNDNNSTRSPRENWEKFDKESTDNGTITKPSDSAKGTPSNNHLLSITGSMSSSSKRLPPIENSVPRLNLDNNESFDAYGNYNGQDTSSNINKVKERKVRSNHQHHHEARHDKRHAGDGEGHSARHRHRHHGEKEADQEEKKRHRRHRKHRHEREGEELTEEEKERRRRHRRHKHHSKHRGQHEDDQKGRHKEENQSPLGVNDTHASVEDAEDTSEWDSSASDGEKVEESLNSVKASHADNGLSLRIKQANQKSLSKSDDLGLETITGQTKNGGKETDSLERTPTDTADSISVRDRNGSTGSIKTKKASSKVRKSHDSRKMEHSQVFDIDDLGASKSYEV